MWGSTMWGRSGQRSSRSTSDRRRGRRPSGRLDDLTHEIALLLEEGLEHGDCFVILDVEGRERCDNRFVQLAFDGGDVCAEASAMVCLPWECDGRHALTAAQQTRLRALGWLPPAGDPDAGLPNWHREFPSMRADLVPLVAELLARTLVEVMEVRELAELGVTVTRFEEPAPPARSCAWSPRLGRSFCSDSCRSR